MSGTDNPHKGHRQRLRSRVNLLGADSLEPHELLEYLLMFSIPRRNTNPAAHALLDRFKTLDGVFSASIKELCSVEGISVNSAEWLLTVGEAIYSYIHHSYSGTKLASRGETTRFLLEHFKNRTGTWLFCLSISGNIINICPIVPGENWYSAEGIKDIVKCAVESHSSYVILAVARHGNTVSKPETEAENNLSEALAAMQISVLEFASIDKELMRCSYAAVPSPRSHTLKEESSLADAWLSDD